MNTVYKYILLVDVVDVVVIILVKEAIARADVDSWLPAVNLILCSHGM